MPTIASFGDWLRQRRRALGLTHAALAEAVHCSVSALRKIEQDERRPSHHLAVRLAASLQIEPDEHSRFLDFARGERRVEQLAAVSPLAPTPLHRLFAPFDAAMPSIAMLPFSNLSDDAANEHFADGLAEELLNALAKIPGLRVTAQLVQTGTDSHLWAQTYDRELQDIFAVRDDIAHSVVKELRAALLGESRDALSDALVKQQVGVANRGRTVSAQAHQLYLQGRFLIDRHVSEDTKTGIGYCRQALEIDPHYALAWAGLARAYSNQASWGWAPLAQANELSREAANRALQLEPDLPVLGTIRLEQGRVPEAMPAFEQEGVESLRVQGRALVHSASGRSARARKRERRSTS